MHVSMTIAIAFERCCLLEWLYYPPNRQALTSATMEYCELCSVWPSVGCRGG